MSMLYDEEIERIVEVYKQTSSISETARITKHSKITVNKYVINLSSMKKNSRYCKENKIIQIDPQNGNVIMKYKNQKEASVKTNIFTSSINKCIKGITKTAGGYIFVK